MTCVEMRRVCCVLMSLLLTSASCARANPDLAQYDTIIVGVGAAGTAAASRLAARGYRLLAVDAMPRVGGRIYTHPLGDGVVEMGAEWMHGTQPSMVYDTAVAHNITVLEQTFDMPVYTICGRAHHLVKELVDVASDYAFSNNGEAGVSIADYTTRKLTEYVDTNYKDLANSNHPDAMWNVLRYVSLMVGGYEAADWQLVASRSTYRELNGTQYASWGRAGYATYIDILLKKHNNGPGYPNLDIKLGTEVLNIVYDGEGQDGVTVTTTNGTYKATNVIVTVSLGVLKERHLSLFTPPLPADKVAAIEAIPMGLLGKIQVVFQPPWWPDRVANDTSIGFMWSQMEIKALPESRRWIASVPGMTAPLGADDVITFWCHGDTATVVPRLSEEEVRSGVKEILQRFLDKDAPEPKQILRSDWNNNPFTRGSYSYEGLSVTANMRRTLGEPLADSSGTPRVYLAGEATSVKWFSTVHGASSTGWEQAGRIINSTMV